MRTPTLAALALALACPSLPADTVSISPSDDTALMEGFEADFNFGGQYDVPIGTTGAPNSKARTRGLFRFDVAAAVPAGSTITAGRFSLSVERRPHGEADSAFELHRMLVPWIEGDKINNQRPGGRLPDAGEPTWNHRAAPSTTWGTTDTPGGEQGVDYAAAISASEMILSTIRTYQWDLNATGIADLQAMLDTPASNFGWMLKTAAESTAKTGRRFYTKETIDDPTPDDPPGSPPALEIDFTAPTPPARPEVTQFHYDGTDVTLEFVATAGITYDIEVSETPGPTGWTSVETFNPTTDGTLSATVPNTAPDRSFVRVTATEM